MGRKFKTEYIHTYIRIYIYIYVADSLYCTEEPDTTV